MRVEFAGDPIAIEFRPRLRAHRGKLVLSEEQGVEVHAASFIRLRRIVLDRSLMRRPRERHRILAHELFHFAWLRLGNRTRLAYEAMLRIELQGHVPGETGWSAEWRKDALRSGDRRTRTRRYREYVCESFCDTAACGLLGIDRHDEITLPPSAFRKRREWMEETLAGRSLRI